MIVFDLQCAPDGHRFEGWFSSSEDFARQQERGLVCCPTCGSAEVNKAVMAPNVGRKGNQLPEPARKAVGGPVPAVANAGPALPPEAAAMLRAIAEAQAQALKSSRWVGEDFAEKARAIHYGENDPEAIHGQARPEEVRDLLEEGVEIAPILFPVVPPEQAN
ncbi:DUF1178 family protein [Novosphingobium flavum]|uniref:DUF1178 family protein n=1 Tax=Novosphingobium flavum TaxID=1778672 RepID=A0A7X1FT73_9SPHN|nr:DUF1178 family protein [Novosphingobium flavum]MBC2666414.1 DUF1178 family protein [Novosphingobium flavum]